MSDLFFGQHAAWYTVPAILGTAFFALRSVLLLIGSHHLGVDFHGDTQRGRNRSCWKGWCILRPAAGSVLVRVSRRPRVAGRATPI